MTGTHQRRRRWRLLGVAGTLVAVWLLVGLRIVDDDRFGVLHGPLFAGAARQVGPGVVLAPPGLLRLSTYPARGVELPLPQADSAMLRARDGSRYGFRGWITVRPRQDAWRELHAAAAGRGVEGALLEAVRAAADELPPGGELGSDMALLADALRGALGRSLAERGLDLRRLELDAIDFLAAEPGEPGEGGTAAKLLIVGLDGLDWEILDPLLEAGRLPHLARLIDGGVRAKLLTISPMLSPVIWTTVATGVEPSRHGVLDFLVDDPEGGSRQPVTSAQRLVPTFWELISRSGVDVGVTGWWATWPADPVRGYLVSDRLAYQLFGYTADPTDARGKTWPPELYDRIRPLVVTPDDIPWDDVRGYLDGPRLSEAEFDDTERQLLDEFRTLLAAGRTYLAVSRSTRAEFDPRLEIAYFEGTDTVGHLFMPYRPPRLPGIDERRIESFGAIVDRYYETADLYLGELLTGRGDDWTVMVLSDHGFASDATRPRTTDSRIGHGAAADWHRRFGVLILSGRHVRSGVLLDEASVYDIAPTALALFGQPVPRSWPGRVLGSALEERFLDQHPVRYRAEDPQRGDARAEGLIDPAAADLLEKLQSLGYVSAGAAGGGGDDAVTARNNAGVALLAEGRFADAESEFRAGLVTAPGAPMLHVNLGLALRFQGRADEAEAQFEAALSHPTTFRMAGHMLAQIRYERDELDAAESLLREVLAREPDAAELLNTLGQVLEARGNAAAAREQYLRAAELDPDAALARNNLGSLARREGDMQGAETWYLRAIEADPYFMGAYNNLALVYQDLGQMERARDLYARALTKAPDNADVLNNLGSWHYSAGEFDDARKYWQRAALADPRNASPLNNIAGLEINAGRLDEATRLLRRALEIDDEYGDARINLALILATNGDVEAARRELEAATRDPRTGGNAWAKLGALELEVGRNEAAVTALELALQRAPRNVEALNYLGEALRRLGQRERAYELWRRSLEIEPRQPRLRQFLAEEYPGAE